MLNKKVEEAINKQINAEIYSSYLYYAMSAHFGALSLNGFAHWLRVQALEELTHVQKFTAFMVNRGGRVVMQPVEGPPAEWESPLAAFKEVYEHEVKVTGLINGLVDLAMQERDHATVNFLQWFVGEQVEEESTADEVLQKLKMVKQTEGGLFMLDQEMNTRTFVLPPDLVGVF